MHIDTKRKILKRIVAVEAEIQQLKQVRMKLSSAEFQSATMSINGGSRSYSRADITKLESTIKELKNELKNLRKLLGDENQSKPSQIYTIYV